MADVRQLLGESVARLRAVLDQRTPDQPSYCADWSVAQVVSHLGSGAVLGTARLRGEDVDPQPVWDEWNAKSPDAMVRDGLAADAAFLDAVDGLGADERAERRIALGPMELEVDEFLAFRLHEHVVHTWDVEVTGDPTATLQHDAVPVLLDAVPTVAGWAQQPTGTERDIVVTTVHPDRTFRFSLRAGDRGGVTDTDATADLTLPAEALVRLVFGRLDPDHTPEVAGDEAALDELRGAFPGF